MHNWIDTIRTVEDFPKPGIMFKDITPLLQNPAAYQTVVNAFIEIAQASGATVIAGIESRGFFFACPLALSLGLPFVPIRKAGKLPWDTVSAEYDLEYGSAVLEMHTDAVSEGDRVLIVDDVLATGGTAEAAGRLVSSLGATVAGYAFLKKLTFLGGTERLKDAPVYSLVDVTE
jgi:adenine phosphoribosyltransferase